MKTDFAAHIYTDFQGLGKLRQAARENSPEALRETAKQFEGLFIQMLLKSMRDAMPVDGGFDGQQVKFYQGLFDQQVSLDLAQGNGIGLAEVLYRQLGGRANDTPVAQPLKFPATPKVADFAQSPQAFVEQLWPHAVRAGASLGVAPEVLIAQSALETGWGEHVIRDPGGSSSHNLFGIKADRHWQGKRVTVPTLEYESGVAVRKRAAFRAYDSVAASFDDYVSFISSHARYREALASAHDPEKYLKALQEAGYATDPAYAEKIHSIMSRHSFSQLVAKE